MPHLITAPGVSFGFIGERPVFLDVHGDRYATLSSELAAALKEIVGHGGEVAVDDPLANRLLATGLFALGTSPGRVAITNHNPPREGIGDDDQPTFCPTDLIAVAALLVRSGRRIRRSSLKAAVAPPRIKRAPPVGAQSQACLEHSVRRFVRVRTLVPIAPACLADSLALRAFLAARGIACGLTLAVRLEPFQAHCWLEAGGLVLNDSPDRIAGFVPVGTFP